MYMKVIDMLDNIKKIILINPKKYPETLKPKKK